MVMLFKSLIFHRDPVDREKRYFKSLPNNYLKKLNKKQHRFGCREEMERKLLGKSNKRINLNSVFGLRNRVEIEKQIQ